MNRVKTTLTAKIGPLPAWAWAAIAIAVIVGYMWFTKSGFFGAGSQPAATGAADASGLPSGDQAFPGGGLPVQTPSSSGADQFQGFNPTPSYYDPSSGGFTYNPTASALGISSGDSPSSGTISGNVLGGANNILASLGIGPAPTVSSHVLGGAQSVAASTTGATVIPGVPSYGGGSGGIKAQ